MRAMDAEDYRVLGLILFSVISFQKRPSAEALHVRPVQVSMRKAILEPWMPAVILYRPDSPQVPMRIDTMQISATSISVCVFEVSCMSSPFSDRQPPP